jgi:pullulanase/glycogen debranching enzyme
LKFCRLNRRPATCYRQKSRPGRHVAQQAALFSVSLAEGGANFSVFAKHSTGAQLLRFDDVDAEKPSRIIDLDPQANRTYHYWHVFCA